LILVYAINLFQIKVLLNIVNAYLLFIHLEEL